MEKKLFYGYQRSICRVFINKPMVTSLMLVSFLFVLICAPLTAGGPKKTAPTTQNPYETAEYENLPPVNPNDLAYHVILFEEFKVPKVYQKDAAQSVLDTTARAISRLQKAGGFTKVERKGTSLPEDPYLVVACTLVDFKLVGGGSRFFGGALAGSSFITYTMKIYDGKTGNLLHELDIATENNAFAAAWSFNDSDLPFFLGKVMGDYIALRARTDKGVNVLPIEKIFPDGAVYTDPATQLMWSAKDNHEIITWDEAVQYAKNFKGGGFSDWRLPTIQELRGLYNISKTITLQTGKKIHVIDQVKLTSHRLWTSDSKDKKAQYFDFEKGSPSSNDRTDPYSMRVLVVRKAEAAQTEPTTGTQIH